jgi:hypothetical protein
LVSVWCQALGHLAGGSKSGRAKGMAMPGIAAVTQGCARWTLAGDLRRTACAIPPGADTGMYLPCATMSS